MLNSRQQTLYGSEDLRTCENFSLLWYLSHFRKIFLAIMIFGHQSILHIFRHIHTMPSTKQKNKHSFEKLLVQIPFFAPNDYMVVSEDIDNIGICILTTYKRKSIPTRTQPVSQKKVVRKNHRKRRRIE